MAPPPVQKLNDLVRIAQQKIAASGSTSPRLDAEVLLRHVLKLDRVGLFMRLEDPADPAIVDAFDALVARRISGQPVAYLTGRKEFAGLAFAVTPDVLIPRPETELLVEWALAWVDTRNTASVIDVGTGSGAIAVSIATLCRSDDISITASDLSEAALEVARSNADRLLTPFRRSMLSFVEGSLLTWYEQKADLVLANLPYLTDEQISSNPDLDAEPRAALEGGLDGLELVRRLIDDLPRVLDRGGALGLELNPSQIDPVIDMLRRTFLEPTIDVIADLAGHRRHVVMQVPF